MREEKLATFTPKVTLLPAFYTVKFYMGTFNLNVMR